jgi:signal transduction histidine kinase
MARPPGIGTTLASLEIDVWRGHRNEHFASNVRAGFWRPYVGALAFYAAVAVAVGTAGQPLWRLGAVLAIAALHSIGQFVVVRWTADARKVERSVVLATATILVLVSALAALTGGLDSPLVIALPTLLLPSALILGVGRTTRVFAVVLIVFLLLLMKAPKALTGPPLPELHRHALVVAAGLWSMLYLFILTRRVSAATRAASSALGDLREERLTLELGHLRRLQSVGAKVAHELKNPLAAVKGLVQLVARAPDGERSHERLEVVQGEIARMETILHEYLSFARPLEDLAAQPVDLAGLTEAVTAVLAGRADQGQVTVAVTGPAVRLQADPRRLKEALLNVLANAIDFTPPGGRVDVEVAPHEGGGRVTVRDTGHGISPDDLSRVGTSFFTTRETGTGLGVVLAKNVVAQHGGTFHLASERGRGTTVTIQLPGQPPGAAIHLEASDGTAPAGRR